MTETKGLERLGAKRRSRLRAIARRERRRGASLAEIGRRLGLSCAEVKQLLAGGRRYGPSDLDPDAWAEYVSGLVVLEESGQRLVNDRPMSESQSRAFFRWTEERSAANFFAADRWLCAFDLHIDGFFAWCEKHGRCPWARGEEPEWHRLPAQGEGMRELPVSAAG